MFPQSQRLNPTLSAVLLELFTVLLLLLLHPWSFSSWISSLISKLLVKLEYDFVKGSLLLLLKSCLFTISASGLKHTFMWSSKVNLHFHPLNYCLSWTCKIDLLNVMVNYDPSTEAMNCYISTADKTDINWFCHYLICGLSNTELSLLWATIKGFPKSLLRVFNVVT